MRATGGFAEKLKRTLFVRQNFDLTTGPFLSKIIRYAIPIMFTNIFQLLFNAADLMVVGQYCGDKCLAAVGATSALNHLLVNFFIGFSTGTGVVVAKGIGARDDEGVHRTVHTAVPTAVISGVILSVVGILGARTFLSWMGTPADILDLAALYLRIYLGGIIPILLYNYGASILRAAGDTTTPMVILVIAGFLNVGLNLVFVMLFKMDVDGVALATVISQAFACVMVMINLTRRDDACKIRWKKLRIHKSALLPILRIGLPAGLQSALFSISNVIIQSSVNTFGSTVLSGNTAAANLEAFVYSAMTSFYYTVMNFVGQNLGAKKYDNVKKCVGICAGGVTVMGLFLGGMVNLFGRPLLSLYLADAPEAAYQAGLIRLMMLSLPYFTCGLMDVMTGTLRGMGYSLQPMIITAIGTCGIRLFWALVLFRFEAFHSLRSLFLSYSISWTLTASIQFFVFLFIFRRIRRRSDPLPDPNRSC